MLICTIILTNNNRDIIEDIVIRCRKVLEPDVLVLDEHSSDGTVETAHKAGAMILEANDGNDSLVVQGLKKAAELGYTHAVVLHAAQAAGNIPEEIPKLVNAAWDAPERILLGVGGTKRTSGFARALASVSAWKRYKDPWAGFRLYPIEEFLQLGCKEKGINIEPEALVRASWAGVPTRHIEISHAHSNPDYMSVNQSVRFGFKLFGGMLLRSPVLLWKRISAL